jgi:arsenate reductase-like glutaredoxin family protein
MNIQIFGTRKDNETKKAERFFKERNIRFHFRELSEKGISKGELKNISESIPLDELIDRNGSEFKRRNLSYIIFNIEEELLNDPLLLKMPLVRNRNLCTAGYRPDIWKGWIEKKD